MNQMEFNQFNLSREVMRGIEELGFAQATDIQACSIPPIMAGQDVTGRSQTGTGKTAAFGIPAVECVDPNLPNAVQVLVLCPTRELAMQACSEIRKFAKYKRGVRALAIYGGQRIEQQIIQLKKRVNIVVGTPGRVIDHLKRRTLKLNNIKMVVLDEADEMLNMGFREDIERILKETPSQRQTTLFSATMPPAIMAITKEYQKNPTFVETKDSEKAITTVEQFVYQIPRGRKLDALRLLLSAQNPQLSIIFCNTKRMVDELCEYLCSHGLAADALHGDMRQFARTKVMEKFRRHEIGILIATDVAARGIDVSNVDMVYNFDVPQNPEYYLHRIGRTGRAGKTGIAVTLASGRAQMDTVREIGKLAGAKIQTAELPVPQKAANDSNPATFQNDWRSLLIPDRDESDRPRGNSHKSKNKGSGGPKDKDVNMANIRLSVGREQNLAPNFIVSAIAQASGISGGQIGKIRILSNYTVVEVPKAQADSIIASVDQIKIKGNTVRAKLYTGQSFGSSSSHQGGKSFYRSFEGIKTKKQKPRITV
jgi:ATP-dependent RNA helicase DeaD